MANLVQMPPSSIPLADSRNYMLPPWRSFFEGLLARAGGVNAGLQPESDILTALSALDATTGFLRQTGADTFTRQALGISATKTSVSSVTIVNGIITAWS